MVIRKTLTRNHPAQVDQKEDHWTEMVTGGCAPPHSVAVTVVDIPEAVELTVAAPPVMDGMTAVFEIVHVTTLVTSC